MKTITLTSAQSGDKWIVFREGADLSDFDAARLVTWEFESRPVTTGTLIQTADKVSVAPTSPAYSLAYNLAFALVHCAKVTGPQASNTPDDAFLNDLPPSVLMGYVLRADTSQALNDAEFEDLKKKPTPTAVKKKSSGGASD